jgi:hypothetical protein
MQGPRRAGTMQISRAGLTNCLQYHGRALGCFGMGVVSALQITVADAPMLPRLGAPGEACEKDGGCVRIT